MANKNDEVVLHEYTQCDGCSQSPIRGLRFKCSTCEDVDLCEACFDKKLAGSDEPLLKRCRGHEFKLFELQELANGLVFHYDQKCVACYMKPIIGTCFVCADCD